MAENSNLQDTLLCELSDVNLFCKLIRYPSIRDNMYKVFKVSEQKKTQLICERILYQWKLIMSCLDGQEWCCWGRHTEKCHALQLLYAYSRYHQWHDRLHIFDKNVKFTITVMMSFLALYLCFMSQQHQFELIKQQYSWHTRQFYHLQKIISKVFFWVCHEYC